MIYVHNLVKWLDEIAPFCGAEEWDNVGPLIGDYSKNVSRVLVSLDVDKHSLEKALSLECDCIISHHPLLFKPLRTIVRGYYPSDLIYKLVKHDISVIAIHTNLDASTHGTNCILADCVGLRDIRPIKKLALPEPPQNYFGMGVVGQLSSPVSFNLLLTRVSEVLGGSILMYGGPKDRKIEKVAICSGSGGSMVDDVIRAGVDCFITGEIKYHEAQLAIYNGVNIIAGGHFATEFLVVQRLVTFLRDKAADSNIELEIFGLSSATDVFEFYTP